MVIVTLFVALAVALGGVVVVFVDGGEDGGGE